MATEARRRFFHFYLPCEQTSDHIGTWNGTGYDIFSETPLTIKAMAKEIGDKSGDLMGIADAERELRQSIDAAKKGYSEKIKRGHMLLQLLGDCPEEILEPVDRLAIKAYRSSIRPQKSEK